VLKYNSGLDLWENVPSADITGSFATLGSNTFTGGQTIQNNDGLVLQNNGGTGDVIITPGPDYITKFDSSTLTGIEIYGGNTLSSSFGSVGNITGGYGVQAKLGPANNLRLGHGDSYSSFLSNGAIGEVRLRGDKITMQGSSSVDSGVSLTINGDVSASVFTGSFVGDGSGLTLDSNIAYTNVSNTFTQAQTINGVTTINDETTDSNFKIFTVQKNNNDILTLFNSSSANNNEGELTLKGGLNVISEQGQNKIFVEDAGGNSAIIGTDSIGIKGASDSIPFTQLTAGGVWGRSLDSDNNDTALWISGTPTKINNYGYQLQSKYNDTVGVYTARGPQFGGTLAQPMFYQYISSSAEYLAGDATIHFGTTITGDEGFRTFPSILAGTTPMDIFNSNGRKFKIEAGGLESLGQPAIQMFGFIEVSGELFANSLQSEPANADTPSLFVTDAIQPRLIVNSQNGAIAEGWNIQLNGEIDVPSGNISLSGANQVINNPNGLVEAGEVATPALLVDTIQVNNATVITLSNNTIISGSLTLMPNVPIEATQVQANESVISPFIESQTGTFTIGSNTVISGSVDVVAGVPVVATQFEAREAVITPIIESTTGTVTIGSNTIRLQANGGILQLSGSNVAIESPQPVSFNAGLTVNGATNFNTAVYKNRQEASAANVNLTNETDNFVITLINGTTTNVAMQDLVGNNLNREVTLMVKQPSVGFGNLNFVTGSYGDPYNVMYAAGQSPYTASQAADAVDTITLKSVGSTYDGTNYPIIVTGVYLDISGDLV
jgi:hypothetical protein